MTDLGTMTEVTDLRCVWQNEARDFTPWLAENIYYLSNAIGIDIAVEETESSVGDFNVEIFATDADTGKSIIIENHLEETNHDHLGKLITYASGKDASLIIWIVRKARPEHIAAIEWLNNHTDEGVGFFLCEIKLFRIVDSLPAPKFEIIEQPNNWIKQNNIKKQKALPRIADMISWGVVSEGDILVTDKQPDNEATLLANGNVMNNGEEMSLYSWLMGIYNQQAIKTYKVTRLKESGKTLSQIRKEYMEKAEIAEE